MRRTEVLDRKSSPWRLAVEDGPFTFDLRSEHLGDVLLALPAMRSGDRVLCHPMHYFGPASIASSGDKRVVLPKTGHKTQGWLGATDRQAVKHSLMAQSRKQGVVIAPSVKASIKRWNKWAKLRQAIGQLTEIHEDDSRSIWMNALNRAAVVICPDTGTGHMADALGCPKVIAMYGSGQDQFERYAPFWDGSWCIVRDNMADITVEDVLERIHGQPAT